jgi:uncharacterized membrane protein YdfJ with MMPL/SSD domain
VVILVAVGSDDNLLVVSRLKEEIHAGLNTGIIRGPRAGVGKAAIGTAQLGEAGKRCVAIVVSASADRRRGGAGRCC